MGHRFQHCNHHLEILLDFKIPSFHLERGAGAMLDPSFRWKETKKSEVEGTRGEICNALVMRVMMAMTVMTMVMMLMTTFMMMMAVVTMVMMVMAMVTMVMAVVMATVKMVMAVVMMDMTGKDSEGEGSW